MIRWFRSLFRRRHGLTITIGPVIDGASIEQLLNHARRK